MFLQNKKISFASERTRAEVPGLQRADVNKENQILLRVKVNDESLTGVLDRFSSREILPAIPSACNHHTPCIIAHPSDPRSVLESCLLCGVIRNYGVCAGESCVVYTRCVVYKDLRPIEMCRGPVDCILVNEPRSQRVIKLKWEKEQLFMDCSRVQEYKYVELIEKLCYVEPFNIIVIMSHKKEVKAVKFGNDNPIWELPGTVGGHVVEPDALTVDAEGNVYVSDGVNNRILKINALNGEIMHVLLLEGESTKPIDFLFWSDTEPNLTLIRGDRISTYNIPKFD